MAVKTKVGDLLPLPPLPKFMLDPTDPEYAKPEPLKPDDMRARLQLQAVMALDVLEWHARNLADSRASEDACRELLDRAGYVAPAKSKDGAMGAMGSGGGALPSIEQDVKELADSFSTIPTPRRVVEEEEE